MSSTDLPSLLRQSKSQHTIQDKSTGQVLGYAFFINDQQSVSADQVQLVPWQLEEDVHHLPGNVHTKALLLPCSSPPTGNVPGIHLVSDLDLSESSTNETYENDSSPNVNEVEKNQGHNLRTSPSISNTCDVQPIQYTALSMITQPTSPIRSKELPNMLHPPSTASNIRFTAFPNPAISSKKPSPGCYLPNIISKPTTTHQDSPDKLQAMTKSLTLDIVSTLNRQDNVEDNVHRKRSLEDDHETRVVNKRLDTNFNFSPTPGMNSRYEAFYEHVSEEGVERKYRRVKCLLCGDGKVLLLGNFNRHVKAIHEPPVKCEVCERQFSGQQIKVHRRTCGQNMNNSNDLNKCSQHSPSPVGLPRDNTSVDTPESKFGSCVKNSHGDLSPFTVSSESLNTPALLEQTSGTDSEWAFLVLASVVLDKARIKIKVKKEARIKKAMKAFGKKHEVDYKKLKFLIGGAELTGEEIVGDIVGNKIDVYGELSN